MYKDYMVNITNVAKVKACMFTCLKTFTILLWSRVTLSWFFVHQVITHK